MFQDLKNFLNVKFLHRMNFLYISMIVTGLFLFVVAYQIHFASNTVKLRESTTTGKNNKPTVLGQHEMDTPKVKGKIKWNTQCNGYNYALIVNIRNRLGNNMFQVASSLGMAYKNGLVPVFPQQWSKVFKMFNFTVPLYETLPESCKKYKTFIYYQIRKSANIYDPQTEEFGYISQQLKSNIRIDGLWENGKYFEDIKDEVRKQFTFTDAIKNVAEAFLKEEMTKRFHGEQFVKVGVHLRFTDRGKWKEKGTEYIQKAISFYQQLYKKLLFVVCSDDISTAREILPRNISIIYSEKFGDKPWVDMAVLTLCDHSIISVGTFGWWAGWLTGGKVVCMYSKDQLKYPSTNIYPKQWVKL